MNKKRLFTVLVLTLAALALLVVPISANGPVILEGTTNYYTYALKSQTLLQDVTLDAEAELQFLGGQEIVLVLTEHTGYKPRTTPMPGKLTPSGQLKLWFPDPLPLALPPGVTSIIDLVEWHTGCEVLGGTFPVWHGTWDGERLAARATFVTRCDGEGPNNDLFPMPQEGIVDWQWSMDLTVVD